MKISLKGCSFSDGLIMIANRVPDRMKDIAPEELRSFLIKASEHIITLEETWGEKGEYLGYLAPTWVARDKP